MAFGVKVVCAMLLFFLAESFLPCALKQMNMPTFLKMSWRAQASLLLLLPSVAAEAWAKGGVGWMACELSGIQTHTAQSASRSRLHRVRVRLKLVWFRLD